VARKQELKMHLLRIYKPTKEGGKKNATPRPFSSKFAKGIAEAFMFGCGGCSGG
jgi:hypothetical protein